MNIPRDKELRNVRGGISVRAHDQSLFSPHIWIESDPVFCLRHCLNVKIIPKIKGRSRFLALLWKVGVIPFSWFLLSLLLSA